MLLNLSDRTETNASSSIKRLLAKHQGVLMEKMKLGEKSYFEFTFQLDTIHLQY